MSNQETNWTKIFTSGDPMKVGIVKGVLHDHDIPVIEMNKQDSAYVILGEIDLMVPEENAHAASLLVDEFRDGREKQE